MTDRDEAALTKGLAESVLPVNGSPDDFEPLLDLLGDASVVLLGEATHGTHEFYRMRTTLTKRLVLEHGARAVAIEGDWPDAYRVNRFVQGLHGTGGPEAALADFRRFPAWMWRNTDVVELISWLREHNERREPEERVGLYGLDLYSLNASMRAVVAYLRRVDPAAAKRAEERYACFDQHAQDPEASASATSLGVSDDCEAEVVAELVELLESREDLLERDGLVAEDAQFAASQNARVVTNAEEYYRTMLGSGLSSWNLRDRHMADTLDGVLEHLGRGQPDPRVVVWAHNSHVGDARATDRAAVGELNVGQLARERHPGRTCHVGFTTYTGSVTAASSWGGTPERKRVRPALEGSVEALFHRVGVPKFLLRLDELGSIASALAEPRLERAIGAVYRPETERESHFFEARIAHQFDAVVHCDETHAIEPLERVTAHPVHRLHAPRT